jgi:UDP-GlcNAc:undecaprenyl-phosphate GlcNAc-1-phosphate transferase
MPILTLILSVLIGLIALRLLQPAGRRLGLVSEPRIDRWNRASVTTVGGIGVFIAGGLALLLTGGEGAAEHRGLLLGAGLIFLVGLYDDLRELSPPVKLIAQIMVALVVIFSGYRTGFFRSELLNILVTVIWLVGITNALNLLDNMDGLAGGISLIAAGFMSYFFWRNGADHDLLVISMALLGGLAAFLVHNFPPARIFMGDSGSLLFGFTLASLAIAKTPQASNVFAVLGVPALLFTLPILDTVFVTITRLMRGQSPAQGGRDHTSHRLVAFGLSERQTVLVLYAIAVVSGAAGAVVESLDYTLSLVLIPVLLVAFAVLAAYLSRLKVVDTAVREGPLTNLLQGLTYRRRLFEIALDFFLASIAYYLAFWSQGGFSLDDPGLDRLVQSLPIAIGGTYLGFFTLGVYRGVWQYIGLRDLVRLGLAVAAGAAATGLVEVLVLPDGSFSPQVVFLFAVFLFVGAATVRSSFRLLDELAPHPVGQGKGGLRVLIFDAGDGADLLLRYLATGGAGAYEVVGFLDDDEFNRGRRIHDIDVLGGTGDAREILQVHDVVGVIAVTGASNRPGFTALRSACAETSVWIRELTIGFEEI